VHAVAAAELLAGLVLCACSGGQGSVHAEPYEPADHRVSDDGELPVDRQRSDVTYQELGDHLVDRNRLELLEAH
jgi:hypothetical protein